MKSSFCKSNSFNDVVFSQMGQWIFFTMATISLMLGLVKSECSNITTDCTLKVPRVSKFDFTQSLLAVISQSPLCNIIKVAVPVQNGTAVILRDQTWGFN